MTDDERDPTVAVPAGSVTVYTGYEVVCPFCGMKVRLGKLAYRGVASQDYGALHPTPMCETYQRLDLVEYITAVRMHYAPHTAS